MTTISPIWQSPLRLMMLALLVTPILAACGGGMGSSVKRSAFTSREFGVSVSPRVSTARNPPHGGGRYLPLRPYTVRGVLYEPVEGPGYVERGQASWYGYDFHGRRTANGEIFSATYLTAASPTLPVPCYARVTNLENGRSVIVRINDRGPYMSGRIIDVSLKTAEVLGFSGKGSAGVQVAYVGPAPLNGDDTRMLMASLNQTSPMEQGGTQVAMLDPENVLPTNGKINLADFKQQAPRPTNRDPFSGGLLGAFTGLFSYAEAEQENAVILDAHDAVNAMATRASALDEWVNAVDTDKRQIKLQLGVFSNRQGAVKVAEVFAFLGAVDDEQVAIGDHLATRLTLTKLKPGVARTDVLNLARELGLNDIVLY